MYIIYDNTSTENGRVIIIELNGKIWGNFNFRNRLSCIEKKRNDPTFKQIDE